MDSANKGSLNIRRNPKGIIFKIFVQPKSSKNVVVGLHGDALKIKLTAPPVDNAANKICIKFLAKALGVSKSSLEIVSGHSSRSKQILLRSEGANTPENEYNRLRQAIERLLP